MSFPSDSAMLVYRYNTTAVTVTSHPCLFVKCDVTNDVQIVQVQFPILSLILMIKGNVNVKWQQWYNDCTLHNRVRVQSTLRNCNLGRNTDSPVDKHEGINDVFAKWYFSDDATYTFSPNAHSVTATGREKFNHELWVLVYFLSRSLIHQPGPNYPQFVIGNHKIVTFICWIFMIFILY